ncbi:MAG: LysR family transcriptional regulator [Pseudomonadota bacterium]
MKPSPHQITAFTEAARQRSFSAAARVLGVTQSSITQHVAKLERQVGTPLFIRQRDGLVLTRTGRSLFGLTDQMRSLEEAVQERLTEFGTLSAGSLRIIGNAPRPALDYITAFLKVHPGIEINLRLATWEQVVESLNARDCDLAFLTDPPANHGLTSRLIGHVGYRAYARGEDPLAALEEVRLADLADRTLVVPEDGSLTQRIVRQAFAGAGMPLPRLLKAGTFPLVKETVLHGAGIGIMLDASVHDDPRLVARPIRGMARRHAIHLVTQPDRRDLRLIARFYEVCADQPQPAACAGTRRAKGAI